MKNEHPEKKTSTIYSVAELASVSISTVSRIINENYKGNPAIKQRVLDVMSSLDYQPRPEARKLMGKRVESRMIGILAPFFTHPFFVEVLKGIYEIIHEYDYNILLYDVSTRRMKKRTFRKIITEKFLDGIVLVNMHLNDEEFYGFSEFMPMVLAAAEHHLADSVMVDHYAGISAGVRHLFELGHRHVAFINNQTEIYESQIREKAFREEAERCGISYNINYQSVDRRGGYLGAMSIIDNNPETTCLFYYSDLMAYGGLDYLDEKNLSGQVSLMGFDGFDMTFQVNLTTIVQPMMKMGEIAARMLFDRIADPSGPRQAKVLVPWIKPGKTCRRIDIER